MKHTFLYRGYNEELKINWTGGLKKVEHRLSRFVILWIKRENLSTNYTNL